MAEAAEETVTLNKIQIFLGIAGALLLFITIIYSRHATHAAIRAAKAAERANTVAYKTSLKELRPYVTVQSSYAVDLDPGQDPEVNVVFLNSGQTPARYLTTALAVELVNEIPKKPPNFNSVPKTIGRSIIGPDGDAKVSGRLGKVLTEEEFEAILFGSTLIHAYGRVEYQDIESKTRWTTFSMVMGGRFETSGNLAFKACPKGNDAT